MYIYITTNKINGKIYIGKSVKDINKSTDYIGSGLLLKRAINKYGKENFHKDILYYTEDSKHLNKIEKYFIKLFDARNISIGYNIAEGGIGGNCGNQYTRGNHNTNPIFKPMEKMTPEEKEKHLDEKYRGDNHYSKRCMSEEERNNWIVNRCNENNPNFGKRHTSEWKEKHSKILSGRYMPPMSDECKQKISKANSGAKNGMSKSYKITYEDGRIVNIKGMAEYCRSENISEYKLSKIANIEEIKKNVSYLRV
jgi:group I intron endonuclease